MNSNCYFNFFNIAQNINIYSKYILIKEKKLIWQSILKSINSLLIMYLKLN